MFTNVIHLHLPFDFVFLLLTPKTFDVQGGAEAKAGGGAPRVGEAKDPSMRARADSKAAKEIVWSKESDYET